MTPSLIKLCLAILVLLTTSVTGDFQLTILHTNDVHARIEESDRYGGPCTEELAASQKCYGGTSRLRTLVNQKRKQFPDHVLLLDAGDQYQGTLWFYLFGGNVTAEFMNLIGYDAMAVGNHEFDLGIDGLLPFVQDANFSVLSSNMQLDHTPKLRGQIQKSTVIIRDNKAIGVVGYTTSETPDLSDTETVTFMPELEAIQSEVDKLVNQGIDIIIAVGHSGYSVDLELGKQLKNVDVIVGGHTNTFLYNGEPPSNDKAQGPYPTVVDNVHDNRKVLVIQDFAYGKYLGELHVAFDDTGNLKNWSGNPILLDHTVAKDPDMLKLVDKYLPEIQSLKNDTIGRTVVDLMADRFTCRTTECILGDVIADALIAQNLRQNHNNSWAEVAISFVNAGGFRASIPPGPITVEQVLFVQPFRNTMDVVYVTGNGLKNIFEFCASKYTEVYIDLFGGFLQVSGLRVTYDMTQPIGERVVELMAVCTDCLVPMLEMVEPDKIYRVLTSSFLSNGGDGYHVIHENTIKKQILGAVDSEMVLAHIKNISPVWQRVEGRILHKKNLASFQSCVGSYIQPESQMLLGMLLMAIFML